MGRLVSTRRKQRERGVVLLAVVDTSFLSTFSPRPASRSQTRSLIGFSFQLSFDLRCRLLSEQPCGDVTRAFLLACLRERGVVEMSMKIERIERGERGKPGHPMNRMFRCDDYWVNLACSRVVFTWTCFTRATSKGCSCLSARNYEPKDEKGKNSQLPRFAFRKKVVCLKKKPGEKKGRAF